MRIPLILLASSLTAPLTALAEGPRLETAPVEKVFAPLGFDDNDDVELVAHGHFANTCYKVGPATAAVDLATRKIEVTAQTYHYLGVGCAQMLVPFIQSIKLGILALGDYTVSVVGRPQVESWPLHVVAARSAAPDDYLYAPVDTVHVEGTAATGHKVVVEGTYPLMLVGCMKMTELREQVTPGRVVVIQPLAEIFLADEDCVDQPRTYKFRFETPITDAREAAEYLVHVRVLAGHSLNQIVSFEE